MTRAPIDDSQAFSEEPTPAQGRFGAKDPARKLAAFREKLDAFRMRARAQHAPIGAKACDEKQSKVSKLQHESCAEARGEQRTPPGEELAGAAERFEIVMPPEAMGAVAIRRSGASRLELQAPLAAGLAFAAMLTAGASLLGQFDGASAPGWNAAEAGAGLDALGFADIETASLPVRSGEDSWRGESLYLSGEALQTLLAERSVKCVVEAPAAASGPVDLEALRIAGSLASRCVETIAYDASSSLMLREAAARGGGRIEINAAYSIEGGALCHQTRGLSALVIGGNMPQERARSLENLLKASYADLRGLPICHRLQPLGEAPDGPLFRADAFVGGVRVAERTDPRPFIMKRRSQAPAL